MRTKIGVVILLTILFVNSIFAQFPIWDKKERQNYLVHIPADSNSDAIHPFINKRLGQNSLFKSSVWDGDYQLRTELNGVINVSSDITTNTIWTADNTYYVLQLIDVNSAMLVIEPGTTIRFAAGVNAGIRVLNGGTIISRGTPNEPILFTSDASSPWISDYYYAIRIDETASTASVITYNAIEYAYAGIALFNISLDTDIENNYLTSCEWGIIEYGPGHTDIINNLCFGSGYCGIYVNMESLTGVADANSHIIVQNNTCDYQERGMRIYGADNCDYAGFLELKNNLFSSSNEIGLSVMNCIYITVANTGFYNNIMDKSCTGIPDYNSVQAYVDPYIDGPGSLEHCHLNQGCPFINAGLEYIEETPLIGKTTDLADTPDSNRVDIGFHHPNWDYSNAGTTTLRADFDNSLTVDFNDLSFFTDYWLFDYNNAEEVWWWDWDDSGKIDFGDLAVVAEYWLSPFDFSEFTDFARQWQKGVDYRLFDTRPDLNADNIVDFEDFTVLASEWRQTGDAEPNLVPVISGNSNNGYVEVGVSGFTSDTQRVFLFVDGEYRREIFNFWDDYTAWTDISEFGSQERQIKLVGISKTGQITCSNIMDIAFTCPLRYCFFPRDYEPNTPLYFSAINPGPEDVSVNVYADGGDLVWSQTCSGDNIFGSIPAGITNQYELDYVSFIKGTNEPISKVTCVAVVLKNSDPGIEALIILPNEKIKLYDKKSISMVRTAFKNNSVKYQELSLFYATHDNIAWLAQNRNIKYIYITSHGHYLATENSEISRTSVELWDGWTVSVKQSDFPPGLAPSWCVELDGNLENTLNSFYTMGFTSLEFAYFDCCYSGHLQINTYGMLTDGQSGYKGVVLDEPVSDITLALGIHNPNKSRFYQGWYDKPDSRIWFFPQTAFQKWTQREWEILGYPYNLETALTMVFNEQTEFGPDSPANNFRIKGQGFFFDMILNGN